MGSQKLLGIELENNKKQDILEKIKKYIEGPMTFYHIVSINPENIVVSCYNKEFKYIIETAQIKINDGVGVIAAARLLSIPAGERVTGVGLMSELIKMAGSMRLRVLLIGGKANLAERLAACYQESYPEAKFLGTIGIKDIRNPTSDEEDRIFSIVSTNKPHLVLTAFGSPAQELWLYRNKAKFPCVCMGVGGSFDYLGGIIKRPPKIIRDIGLEWLYRLIAQPWRWQRQLRLLKFIWFVLKQKFSLN